MAEKRNTTYSIHLIYFDWGILVESHTVEVEEIHADLYQKALDGLDNPEAVECYYACSDYGYTCENET